MEEKQRDPTGTPPGASSVGQSKPADAQSSEQLASRRRVGGHKRKAASVNSGGGSTAQAVPSKRQAREKPASVSFPLIHHNGPFTRARVQPNNNGVSAVEPTESASAETSVKVEELNEVNENWEALEAKIEAEYEAIRSRDANVHVVPVHAGWFSWTKIHPLEEKLFPSFFSGKSESRTPEIYMEIRNSIMMKFHSNPNARIESKDLAELTVGELDARQEVMEFLDYWGLINYHPFPQDGPHTVSPDSDTNASADANELGKTDSLVEKLFRFETEESWTPVVPKFNLEMPAMPTGLFPESVVAEELLKSEGPNVDYHCNSCSADCSRKRYHCQKQADFDLCAECFNNGKFGSNMSPSDFILMEPAEAAGASGGKWTDQETLLLLEAIEIFRDNWSEIAEHVATKTKAQCILHFVQMPIEDAFLNHDDEMDATPKENGDPASHDNNKSAPENGQNEDTSTPKDVTDQTERSPGNANDDQASCCPMEISKLEEEQTRSDVKSEDGESFALKALKEAFEVVGSPPSPAERLSFAEASNPVMTMAAFLVRLVEPNIAAASVRSFLKLLSGDSSGEQLAARHCFRLEDPPENNRIAVDTEGVAAETTGLEGQKNEILDAEKQKSEKFDSMAGEISSHNDKNDNEIKDSATGDGKLIAVPGNEQAEKASDTGKESEVMVTEEEAQPAPVSESSNPDLPADQAKKNAEESGSKTEGPSNTVRESRDVASTVERPQPKDPLRDGDKLSNSGHEENEHLVAPELVTEKEEKTGLGKTKECDHDKTVLSANEGKACDDEKKDNSVTKDDIPIDKLKGAAVTALSAAAVKAKLLAEQEEDHIRELTAFLIEKQLYKLETKLAFFSDMDNVVMRVKEQLDRSKQRLLHERAQIIATRLGISPSSARPMSQALPANRVGMPIPNNVSRAFMGMASLRPPVSRPLMASNLPPSSFTPATMPGSSVQTNSDKLSSVGTK